MMAGSHVALGAAAWFAAAPHLGLPALDPLPLGLAVAGALLPDIDHPKSWVGKRMRPLSTILARILGHRGATHSLLAVIGCGWLLAWHGTPNAIAAPVLVGYLSHLAGDLLTPRGLRLAWPFKGTWALPLCRSGSPFEPLVVAALLLWAWGAAAGPQTRQSLVWASGICAWVGSDRVPTLCSPRHADAIVGALPRTPPGLRPGPTEGRWPLEPATFLAAQQPSKTPKDVGGRDKPGHDGKGQGVHRLVL